MKRVDVAAYPSRKVEHARYITTGVLVAFALAVLADVIFWQSLSVQTALVTVGLPVSSAIAVVMSLVAWRSLSARVRATWLLVGLGAALSTLSHLGMQLPEGLAIQTNHIFRLGGYLLVLAGVINAVHQREGGRGSELALDIALLFTAITLVVLQWAPGARGIAVTKELSAPLLLVVLSPAAALSALVLVVVLLTGPKNTLAPGALAGLAFGVLGLCIASLPQLLRGEPCCHAGGLGIVPAMGAWIAFAAGSSSAWAAGDLSVPPPTRERLRHFVAPLVAVVLAGISLDAGLRPPLEPTTAVALGLLGALVALRLTELIIATRMQVTERRELAQTRALVEVSRALAGKNDLDTTLQVVTQWAAKVLNGRAAAVELLSSDSNTLVLRAAYGLPDHAIGMEFPLEGSFTGWVILHGEARVTTRSNRDPYITPASAKFLGDSPVAAMPLRYRDQVLGVLSCVGNRPFDAADLDLLRAFASQTALALEDARLFEQVRALSITDPLTGLANRRQLERELSREFAAAQRGRKLAAVMFDLDDFKHHNDTYGHLAGDDVLRRFAEALRAMTRTMNSAARFGGDEFFSLLADGDAEGAETFVVRVKERFQRILDATGCPPIHVSAGIAEYSQDMTSPEDLIIAADRALYVEKQGVDVTS